MKRASGPASVWSDAEYDYELLEYIDGWTLEELVRLNSGGVFGDLLTQWSRTLLGLLVELQTAQPPIIHRDLRPANTMVRRENLEFVLIDFTSAILFDPFKEANAVGTPGFAPPEVLTGSPSPGSDVFSAGVTIYAMNSGNVPPNVLKRQYFGASLALADAEYEVDRVFARMIAFDPERRFSTAQEVLQSMARPTWTQQYRRFKDFRLPDGRTIKQGGWF